MSDAWYVAEPDGETWGPYKFQDLLRASLARQFATGSLVWHADLGEWQPLAKHAAGAVNLTSTPASTRAAAASVTTSTPKARPARTAGASPAKPPPLQGKMPNAKDRTKVDALLREAEAKRGDVTRAASQNAEASARKLAWVGKRLAARYIDVFSIGLFGASAWWAATEGRQGVEAEAVAELWLLLFMALAVWFVVESLLIGLFGTTPGKWLLGLRVRDARGDAPGVARAFRRSFAVYARGLAFGLAILTPIAILVAGAQTLSKGEAPWDQGLVVEDASIGTRWQLIAFLVIVLWIAAVEGWWLELATALLR